MASDRQVLVPHVMLLCYLRPPPDWWYFCCSCVIVIDYFQILNSITEDILGHAGSFKNPLDQYEFIKKEFEKSGKYF